MQRRQFTHGGLPLLLAAGWPVSASWAGLFDSVDAEAALRLALEKGAASAISLLGRTDGYLKNPSVFIPLPEDAHQAANLLKMAGQQDKVDALVVGMNRAAEAAAPKAQPLLLQAVRDMKVDDAMAIVRGDDTSVTRFFETKTRAPLTESFRPVVAEAVQSVSLVEMYNAMLEHARRLSFWRQKPGADLSVEGYVTRKAIDGVYKMIATEERKLRSNPVATGSELLRKVFGKF